MLYAIAQYLYEYDYETHVGSTNFFGPFASKEQGEAFVKLLTEDISAWSRTNNPEDIDGWEHLGWARDIEPEDLISSPFDPLKIPFLKRELQLYRKKTSWQNEEHKAFHVNRLAKNLESAEGIAEKLEALGLERPQEETV